MERKSIILTKHSVRGTSLRVAVEAVSMPRAKFETVTSDHCRSCGACCGPPYPATTYIDLSAPDVARLTATQRRAYVAPEATALATTHTDDGIVCVALRGRIGARVTCAIYERRPDACRRFTPGSRACRRLRAYAGFVSTTRQ